MSVIAISGKAPKIHPTAFIAPEAVLIGDVEIGEESSVWFGCVLRGDIDRIQIGARTNIQDLCVIHVEHGAPAILEDDVTIGHNVTLHACRVKSRVLVGMGSILLDGVVVESDSMIAAGSLLTPGTRVPSGVLMMGAPAQPKRDLTDEERRRILRSAQNYVEYRGMYRR